MPYSIIGEGFGGAILTFVGGIAVIRIHKKGI
jgi:hypothetical protein